MSTQPKVIVTETLAPQAADWLGEHVDLVWCAHDDAALAEHLRDAEGMVVRTYTQVNAALLDQAPHLKVVGRAGVGLDNFDLPACAQRGVRVVYTPDANSQAVVEYVIALMLDTLRPRTDFPDRVDNATFHGLRKTEVGKQLDQLTLGIVGLGRVGKQLGNVAHAIGMKLLVSEILPEQTLRDVVAFPFDYVPHEQLYAQSDVVTIHVDGRADNKHMINAQTLTHLNSQCVFINAARGMLVDALALADWSKQHQDATIILDVHDPEPPTPDYPLYGLDNVRLLPHIASRTDQALANMSWVVKDVLAVLEGHEPAWAAV